MSYLFNISHNLLKNMECHVVSDSYKEVDFMSRFSWLIKSTFVYPLKLLKVGLENGLFKDILKFSFISFLAMLTIVFLAGKVNEELKIVLMDYAFFSLVVIFPLLITLFPLPSSLAFHGVNEKQVNFVVEFLNKNNIRTIGEVDLLLKNINSFEEGVLKRINVFRVGLAIIWAFYVYVLNKVVDSAVVVDPHSFLDAMMFSSYWYIFIILYYALMDSYRRYNDIIYRGLEFGLNEYSYTLINDENNTVTPR